MCASDVLPSPGGPASSTWSSGSPRRRAASMKSASWPLSCSWPTKSVEHPRAQRAVELLLAGPASPGTWMLTLGGRRAHAAFTAPRSAASISASGAASASDFASDRLEHRLGLGGVVAERRPGPRARARGRLVAGRRACELALELAGERLAQLDDHPLGGLAADPGHDLEALRVAGRDRLAQLARRSSPTAPRAPSSGPTPATEISRRNSSRSASVAKP